MENHIGGGVVQYICLVGCRIQPLDGYVPVCLVVTIDVNASVKMKESFMNGDSN